MQASDIEDRYLTRNPILGFTNFHGTESDPNAEIWNIETPSGGFNLMNTRKTAARLQRLILYALINQKQLRVVGKRWSFSDIGFANGALILDTSLLIGTGVIGDPAAYHPEFSGSPQDLFFVEAGAEIRQINRILEQEFGTRALFTSGASNGQTIAGAVSTGTHGSAINYGAMQNMVRGIHLITAEKNLWIERPGKPVLSDTTIRAMGATPAREDGLFDAALVSLGGLGVIVSYAIETSPRYFLETHRVHRNYSAITDAINTLDLSSLELPEGDDPYFFQAVVDPNLDRDIAYITARYKKDVPPDHVIDYDIRTGHGFNNEIQSFLVKALKKFNLINPTTMSEALAWDQKEDNFSGTPGETYDVTSGRKGVLGAAIAIPIEHTSRAVAIARQVINSQPDYSPLVIALRFVKSSDGLMSFTPYDKTCVMDIDGLQDKIGVLAMNKVADELENANIPFNQHWGKSLNIDEARLRQSLGDAKVDAWIRQRNLLLSTVEERFVFSNQRLIDLGLAT